MQQILEEQLVQLERQEQEKENSQSLLVTLEEALLSNTQSLASLEALSTQCREQSTVIQQQAQEVAQQKSSMQALSRTLQALRESNESQVAKMQQTTIEQQNSLTLYQ